MLSFYWVDHQNWKRLQKSAGEFQRRLREQQIVPGNPGTILKDVDVLLESIGREGMVSKSRNGTFPAERLPVLNAAVGYPIESVFKRPLLRDYPNLAGLYILLRVTDLLRTEGNRLVVCPRALEFWRTLNPTEQYFALLEALLFEAQTCVLGGERRPREAPASQAVPAFLSHLSERWREFDSYEAGYDLGPKGTMPTWNLFVQQQLGLIEIRPRTPSAEDRYSPGGRGWLVGSARLTPWGAAVTWALLDFVEKENEAEAEERPEPGALESGDLFEIKIVEPGTAPSADPDEVRAEEQEAEVEEAEDSAADAGFGILQPVFQPSFPEWQRLYRRPGPEERRGVHVFKVSLAGWRGGGGIWRRLAVPPNVSLDRLAQAILDAFRFDDDHLYDFSYRDQRGKSRVYNHPGSHDGPFTNEILVRETGLAPKDAMRFTYDYGDNWEFTVQLESIEPAGALRSPKVIESKGKAPEQYPNYE